MPSLKTLHSLEAYDLIVVGSGNGACGYLHHALRTDPESRVLVLEEGSNFFETSDITHQRNWTQSYAESEIFQLHNTQTKDGLPIFCGRACTMGGGGSINYTMIFESPCWLDRHFGHGSAYWQARQRELGEALSVLNPNPRRTAVSCHVEKQLECHGFHANDRCTAHIPVFESGAGDRFHNFPTQFDAFGQRVHSGVSLVSWYDNPKLDLLTEHQVTRLLLESDVDGTLFCAGIAVLDRRSGREFTLSLGPQSRLLLCAGAATPKLLLKHRDKLNNLAIGADVNDHILLPFGLYLLPPDLEPTGRDQYVDLFATSELSLSADQASGEAETSVANLDVFSGSLSILLYLISHLFLAFWLPNFIKSQMIRRRWLFQWLKRCTRLMVGLINGGLDVLWCVKHPRRFGRHRWPLIAAIIKFSIHRPGSFQPPPASGPNTILLRCFEADSNGIKTDALLAERFMSRFLPLVDSLGQRPHPWIQALIRLFTRMPYTLEQIPGFVSHYSRHDLLTEQHLAGGCLLGKALDLGLENPGHCGLLHGSCNIFVADLSAAPLPRVSPQMTAYLIGYHVAYQHALARRRSNAGRCISATPSA